MTGYSPNGAASAVHLALRAVVAGSADEAELHTLAGSEVLVPTGGVVAPEEAPGEVTLPVYEQEDGTELVPVFTTQARMQQALPQITQHRQVTLGVLAHSWPSEKLALVIDAGTPEEVALTAQGVRQLLDRGAA
ncbi:MULTISPECIES: SseB family protein [unclassified Streptomyces]|uniref:SseB family protein n=1 Tax=unclassified Streptomyces TaxID=2593676 RepID=UPI00117EFBE1|nr:SseB family protein [Streptomyces sp. IB201691-2A2]TRO57504.1 SseB family protein [Streptomyces sp. IB201691-2A2]